MQVSKPSIQNKVEAQSEQRQSNLINEKLKNIGASKNNNNNDK
jgi:hypothetical protein